MSAVPTSSIGPFLLSKNSYRHRNYFLALNLLDAHHFPLFQTTLMIEWVFRTLEASDVFPVTYFFNPEASPWDSDLSVILDRMFNGDVMYLYVRVLFYALILLSADS